MELDEQQKARLKAFDSWMKANLGPAPKPQTKTKLQQKLDYALDDTWRAPWMRRDK